MKGRGTLLFILALALAPAAAAQKLQRAEQGAIPLTLGPFSPDQATVTVKPGDVAWTETVHPAKAARLLETTPERIRPGKVEGVAAGTLLFGYRLATGYAYCPPLDIARSDKDVQCYRDLDNDGTFDGGYVTGDRQGGSRFFSSWLQGLTGIKKAKYELASGDLLTAATARVILTEIKNGAPRFRVRIDNDLIDGTIDCAPVSAGVCDAVGVRLTYAPAADTPNALAISFQGAAQDRGFDLRNPGRPLDLGNIH